MKISHSNFNNTPPHQAKNQSRKHAFVCFRRALIPADTNMMQLHFIIKIAKGWQFAHLFQFLDKRWGASINVVIPYDDDLDFFPQKG